MLMDHNLSINDLSCMSSLYRLSGSIDNELGIKKVEGLRIMNDYGSIEFMEPVDLVDQEIDRIVKIE